MLFDKTPAEILSDDENAKARRLREEQEARERWQRELEEGRQRRQEKQEVARRFREKVSDHSPAGRAKAAIESGDKLFQLVLPLPLEGAGDADPESDHNPVLNAIEALGWRLSQASYVTRPPEPTAVQPTADSLYAIYIFKRSI
jgi:hypothetical protein